MSILHLRYTSLLVKGWRDTLAGWHNLRLHDYHAFYRIPLGSEINVYLGCIELT